MEDGPQHSSVPCCIPCKREPDTGVVVLFSVLWLIYAVRVSALFLVPIFKCQVYQYYFTLTISFTCQGSLPPTCALLVEVEELSLSLNFRSFHLGYVGF